jgi:hypothetical protein
MALDHIVQTKEDQPASEHFIKSQVCTFGLDLREREETLGVTC